MSDLEEDLIRLIPEIEMHTSIFYTLYHGTCIKYELDLQRIIGGKYLYYDWGKRFCIPSWKSIFMYSYFPGEGVHFSTIDPLFTLMETTLGPKAWFDVMLRMKIDQKMPKEEFNCQRNEYKSVAELEQIHLKHEKCILEEFTDKWKTYNNTCYPYFLTNTNLLYVSRYPSIYFSTLLLLGTCQKKDCVTMMETSLS